MKRATLVAVAPWIAICLSLLSIGITARTQARIRQREADRLDRLQRTPFGAGPGEIDVSAAVPSEEDIAAEEQQGLGGASDCWLCSPSGKAEHLGDNCRSGFDGWLWNCGCGFHIAETRVRPLSEHQLADHARVQNLKPHLLKGDSR